MSSDASGCPSSSVNVTSSTGLSPVWSILTDALTKSSRSGFSSSRVAADALPVLPGEPALADSAAHDPVGTWPCTACMPSTDDQAERLPDSNPSANGRIPVTVGVAVGVDVDDGCSLTSATFAALAPVVVMINCGGLAPSRDEKTTTSVDVEMSAKPYCPLPRTVDVTSYSTQVPAATTPTSPMIVF